MTRPATAPAPPRVWRLSPPPVLMLLALALPALTLLGGCRPIGYAPRLVGTWVGAPETAEQRAARTAAGEEPAEAGGDTFTAAREGDDREPRVRTTLESFDVRVTLDLAARGAARMWVGDAENEALTGTWRVASYERDRASLEIIVKRQGENQDRGGPGDKGPGDKGNEEKRRFIVQLLEDDNAFTLSEEGADRFFGRMYFRREGAAAGEPSEPEESDKPDG